MLRASVFLLFTSTLYFTPSSSQQPLPGIPIDPVAAGCQPVLETLGYTCPVNSDENVPELVQIPAAFLRTGVPYRMVLKEFPGWHYEGTPEVNFTVPATWLEMGRFLDTTGFREKGIGTINIPTSRQNFIFPIFYSRINERWEPLEDCLSLNSIIQCRVHQGMFRHHAGLTLLAVNVMSESREAVLAMLQNATQPNPNSKICIPWRDQLSTLCPSTVVYGEAIRYGTSSLRSAMVGCNHPFCFMLPANMAHFYQGGCVYGFNKRCGTIDPATGKETCCPVHDLSLSPTKKIWDILGSWSDNEDNTVARRMRFGVDEYFGCNIRPNTFSTPDFSGVTMLDAMSAPADMPFPHPTLVIQNIVNIAFEDVPSKPFEVVFKKNYEPEYNILAACEKNKIYQSTAMSVFYYDAPTRRWVSIPIQGSDAVGSVAYNEATRTVTATIPPRVAIRNNLSIFLGMITGIPILPNGEHLTAQFFLPPTGLRKVGCCLTNLLLLYIEKSLTTMLHALILFWCSLCRMTCSRRDGPCQATATALDATSCFQSRQAPWRWLCCHRRAVILCS